jgi:hypothetical protein
MFVAVWIIYAADRLLDTHDLEDRHRFHHNHRTQFLTLISIAAVALALLLHRIDPRALHLYALLATLLAVYLLLIHARPSHTRRLPKELAVGIFFPAAVFIPTVARAPELRIALLPAAALFAAVCTLNCLFVYAWEHPQHNSQASTNAHATTHWATQHITQLAACTLALSIAAIFTHNRLPAIACALSTAALLALHHFRNRFSRVHLRATADLVLLTPLVLLPFTRWA